VSALAGIGQVAGAVGGIGVVALPGTPLWTDGLLIAVMAAALVAPACAVRAVARAPAVAARAAAGAASYRDFWWVWMTRLTAVLSNVAVMTYLLYYLTEAVHHPDPTRGQFILVTVAGAGITVTAAASGWLSDRYRRRKAVVAGSMLVMAAAEVVLASRASWPAAVTGAILFGIGYGGYLAIDQALINEVLPRAGRAGQDLGVFNIANVAPQVVGPLLAAPLVAAAGYQALYAVAAVVTLCGAAFLVPIRQVR
jgi:MFS family permease